MFRILVNGSLPTTPLPDQTIPFRPAIALPKVATSHIAPTSVTNPNPPPYPVSSPQQDNDHEPQGYGGDGYFAFWGGYFY
jgi:hypothetical protein